MKAWEDFEQIDNPCKRRVFDMEYFITERLNSPQDFNSSDLEEIISILKTGCLCSDNSCYASIREIVDNFPDWLDEDVIEYFRGVKR